MPGNVFAAIYQGGSYVNEPSLGMTHNEGVASPTFRYRPDVDGLRAVAVLSVICFHLFRTAMPGGYLGVDMFFVLSGYLITAVIWQEIREGRFSVSRFYDRRIRRIMPALLLLLAVTTVVAAVMLLPSDLIGYGNSLLATLVFAANVYFWRDTDYFSRAAEQKPLLHIWSLGVEEQFYILFPLILFLLAHRRPRWALYTIAALTAGSLATNCLALFAGAVLPTFFLLPTRAWELGIGAVLALLPSGTVPGKTQSTVLSVLGAGLVCLGLAFPIELFRIAPVALPVVTGTALLLLVGEDRHSPISRLLGWQPCVFIGVISYSLYLWHWPIIVLSQYYLVRELTLVEKAVALALMMACAIGSWWFVERPFRRKEMSIHRVRMFAGIGVVLLAVAGAAMLQTKGLPNRLNPAASTINRAVGTNYRCAVSDYLVFGKSRACAMNLPSRNPADAEVLLLGNSHAQMYAPVWTSILIEHKQTGLLVPVNGCLPTVAINISRECVDVARANLAEVSKLLRPKIVVVALNWAHEQGGFVDSNGVAVHDFDNQMLVAGLDDLVDRLRSFGNQVILIGPLAEPGWDVASILSRQLAFGHTLDRPTFLPSLDFQRHFGDAIRHFQGREDMQFARPDKIQCPNIRCEYIIDGHSLFSDSNHVASVESMRFREVFEAALAAAVHSDRRTEPGDSAAKSGNPAHE